MPPPEHHRDGLDNQTDHRRRRAAEIGEGWEMFTVWEFKSVDGKQIVRRIRRSHPDDRYYDHYFQRIIWQGESFQEAEKQCRLKK